MITVFRRLGGNAQTVANGIRELLDKTGLLLPVGDPAKPPPRNIHLFNAALQPSFSR